MAKEISMRHTKLKAEEAALILGEISKPSWESRNEGIHERISFADTIWGFDLAGGAYYNTPLRVTYVKPGSRAEKANVRPGDLLLRINNLDTTKMTIREAHDIVLESGMNLKLNVTAPEDLDDSFHYYEDPMWDDAALAEKRLADERARRAKWFKPRDGAFLKLKWPWASKRCQIYRESNCFLVPSKYEELHKDKFPEPLKAIRYLENVILDNMDKERYRLLDEQNLAKEKEKLQQENPEESKIGGENTTKDSKTSENDAIVNEEPVSENKVQKEIQEESPVDNVSIEDNRENGSNDDDIENDDESVALIEEEEEENDENNENVGIKTDEDGNEEAEEVENNETESIENIDEENIGKVSSIEDANSETDEGNENLDIEKDETREVGDEMAEVILHKNDDGGPQIILNHENEQVDSSEGVNETNDVLDESQSENDAHKVEDKDSDSNNNAMTDLVNDSDISDDNAGDNRNI